MKIKRSFENFIDKAIRRFAPECRVTSKDLNYLLQRRAVEASADYICKHMVTAIPFYNKNDLYDFVIPKVDVDGIYCEFGVRRAVSTNYFAKLIGTNCIHGFDSFEGFPSDSMIADKATPGAKWYAGLASEGGQLPKVRENVVLHKGWFNEVLLQFVPTLDKPIAFIHIDCDIYSSTKTIFDSLERHIIKGTIIVFDEYLNYVGWQAHEYRAFQEFVKKTKINYEYIAYTYHQQVAVKIL